MSRGLGTAQQLVLNALASLEAENGAGGRFYVWAIVDRAFALSSRMQSREAGRQAAIQADTAAIRERAAQGDDRAALYLRLTYGQIPCRPRPRQRRTAPFRVMEVGFNPSRVLASLERRGLVSREAVKGGGAAGLTDDGRRLAAQLSVGTTLPLGGVAHG